MISKRLAEKINLQINREIYSAYLYLSMASFLDMISLKGASHWMRAQYNEEMSHAFKMYDYLYTRGARVTMLPIEAPPSQWPTPLAVFEATLAHEKHVTALIKAIYEEAEKEKDIETAKFLEWFLKEQEEEEETARKKVNKFIEAGRDQVKLKTIDEELAQRKIH
jgi:ferritin